MSWERELDIEVACQVEKLVGIETLKIKERARKLKIVKVETQYKFEAQISWKITNWQRTIWKSWGSYNWPMWKNSFFFENLIDYLRLEVNHYHQNTWSK